MRIEPKLLIIFTVILTLKAPITTATDDIFKNKNSKKISLDISCELSAKKTIRMECQKLFSLKERKRKRLSSAINFA